VSHAKSERKELQVLTANAVNTMIDEKHHIKNIREAFSQKHESVLERKGTKLQNETIERPLTQMEEVNRRSMHKQRSSNSLREGLHSQMEMRKSSSLYQSPVPKRTSKMPFFQEGNKQHDLIIVSDQFSNHANKEGLKQ